MKKNKKKTEATEGSIRDLILSSKDLPTVKVNTPEWGMDVYIRSMTAAEKEKFSASIVDKKGKGDLKNFVAKLLVKVLCSDKAGKVRIFKSSDAVALSEKSAVVLDRCLKHATKLNALLPEDLEEMEKNLEGTQDESVT
jgi:hypothetical protein